MATTTIATPSPAQWASAACHFEQRADWRVVRIEGDRYVVLTSATSGAVHYVRADAKGCDCRWYQRTGRQCSHGLAVELAALAEELAEAPAPPSAPAPTASSAADLLADLERQIAERKRTLRCIGYLPGEEHEDARYARLLEMADKVRLTIAEQAGTAAA